MNVAKCRPDIIFTIAGRRVRQFPRLRQMPEPTIAKSESRIRGRGRVQLSLVGLIVLCAMLVLTTGLLTGFVRFAGAPSAVVAVPPGVDEPPSPMPPWGE